MGAGKHLQRAWKETWAWKPIRRAILAGAATLLIGWTFRRLGLSESEESLQQVALGVGTGLVVSVVVWVVEFTWRASVPPLVDWWAFVRRKRAAYLGLQVFTESDVRHDLADLAVRLNEVEYDLGWLLEVVGAAARPIGSEELLDLMMERSKVAVCESDPERQRAELAAYLIPLTNNASLAGFVKSSPREDELIYLISAEGIRALEWWRAVRVRREFGPPRWWCR